MRPRFGLCVLLAATAGFCVSGTGWTDVSPPVSPPTRSHHAMAFDALRGETVVFGGQGLQGTAGYCCHSDTWVWNGTSWTQRFPLHSPAPRYKPAMAYDAARGEVVLFGGGNFSTGQYFADTWVWNGEDWELRSPSVSPPARVEHVMAYDALRQETVLFGGSGGYPFADSWVWNGTTWTQRFPAISPTARALAAMVYDSNYEHVVLFGGQDSVGNVLGDMWIWNGITWTQQTENESSPTPGPHFGHAMAYDASRGHAVLFGGYTTYGTGSSPASDTWLWDGTRWINPAPAIRPSARAMHAMAYDGDRAQTVLFDGVLSTLDADTWIWSGSQPDPSLPSVILSLTELTVTYQEGAPGPFPPKTIDVSSTGAPVFVTALSSTTSGGNWLSVTPLASTTPATFTVNIAPGLLAGTYAGEIAIIASLASNSPQFIPVTLTVTAPPSDSVKPIVLIVPGVLGTKLASPSEVVWLSNHTINQALTFGSLNPLYPLNQLAYDTAGRPVTQLAPYAVTQSGDVGGLFNLASSPTDSKYALDCTGLVGRVWNVWQPKECEDKIYVYNRLFDSLRRAGYSAEPFPYDWRMDIGDLSEQLYNRVLSLTAGAGGQPISLVAHSMGGLIVGEMLRRHSPDVRNHLQAVVLLGTPFEGSVNVYLYFQGWDAMLPPIVDTLATRRIGVNWTSAYQLLPQWSFIQLGGQVAPPANLYSGVFSSRLPALPRWSSLSSMIQSSWSASKAVAPYPRAYAIIGSGFETPTLITDSPRGCFVVHNANGDERVPLRSAAASSWVPVQNLLYVKETHSALPSNPAVIGAVLRVLAGDSLNLEREPYKLQKTTTTGCYLAPAP